MSRTAQRVGHDDVTISRRVERLARFEQFVNQRRRNGWRQYGVALQRQCGVDHRAARILFWRAPIILVMQFHVRGTFTAGGCSREWRAARSPDTRAGRVVVRPVFLNTQECTEARKTITLKCGRTFHFPPIAFKPLGPVCQMRTLARLAYRLFSASGQSGRSKSLQPIRLTLAGHRPQPRGRVENVQTRS
jgi:hypothetical protein